LWKKHFDLQLHFWKAASKHTYLSCPTADLPSPNFHLSSTFLGHSQPSSETILALLLSQALPTMGVVGTTPKGYYKVAFDSPDIQHWAQDLLNSTTASGANALDADYDLMQSWFGSNVILKRFQPIVIHLTRTDLKGNPLNGATWGDDFGATGVRVQATSEPGLSRFLIAAEMTEVFMRDQGFGWFGGSTKPGKAASGGDEGDNGEGLSRFLSRQLMLQQNISLGSQAGFRTGIGNDWLSLPDRPNFVSSVDSPIKDIADPNNPIPVGDLGCTTLFVNYLHFQLGFAIQQIVGAGAPNLSDVYRNLTGDDGDPFPTFSRLLQHAFPGASVVDTSKGDEDNPFPIIFMDFVVLKTTYGKDEVTSWIQDPIHQGVYVDEIYLEVQGLNRDQMGPDLPTLAGEALTFNAPSSTPLVSFNSTESIQFQNPNNVFMPQTIRYPFNVTFTPDSLNNFPSAENTIFGPAAPVPLRLTATLPETKFNLTLTAACDLSFAKAEDPYFSNVTNITPPGSLPTTTDLNPFYFSQDLRVFTATPTIGPNPENPKPTVPVRGSDIHGQLPPEFPAEQANVAGAYTYIQALLKYMNNEYFDPGAVDPFAEANDVVPTQFYVYSQDASVDPYTYGAGTRWPNFNFAIARVRIQSPPGKTASNVRVFFRAWSATTTDTAYDTNVTYRRILDTAGVPVFPLPAPDLHTVPFFATSNTPDTTNPSNPEYGPTGVGANTQDMHTDGVSGGSRWYYFGCFLNFFDPDFPFIRVGTHHCLVAEIAYADTPIRAISGVLPTPQTSDKLAQRNLSVTFAENPGLATKLVPQTFDLKPSTPVSGTSLTSDQMRPDDLMMEWNNIPPNSTCQIYWPAINAADVVSLANKYSATQHLSVIDPNTIQLLTTAAFSYLPIPASSGDNFAGLITINLPMSIVSGQKYLVTLRRLTGIAKERVVPPAIAIVEKAVNVVQPSPAPTATATTAAAPAATGPSPSVFTFGTPLTNPIFPPRDGPNAYHYRVEIGSFAVTIPVTSAQNIVHSEIDTLAIMKYRLADMDPSDRW
jgi:hypothetical protein